jgi:hypothetical protein
MPLSNLKMREATASNVKRWSERVENAELMVMAARASNRPISAHEAESALKVARRMLARAQRLHFLQIQGGFTFP